MNTRENNFKLLNPKKIKMSKQKAYLLLTFAASVSAFSIYFFVIAINLYAPGLGGIATFISYTTNDLLWLHGHEWMNARAAADSVLYWIVYFLLNIPIIYLTLRWFSNRFLIYSVYFFFMNMFFTFIISNIPGISSGIIDIHSIEGDDSASQVLLYTVVFIFAILGGVTSGYALGITFKVGGCTMGLDPIVKFVSRERNLNLAPIIMFIAGITMTLSSVVGASIPNTLGETPPIAMQNNLLRSTLLSPEYMGSWIFIVSYSIVADSIFSPAKKVRLTANSEKTDEISQYLNESAFHRGHSILEMKGGHTGINRKAVMIIMHYQEMYDVVEKIAAIDEKAFIYVEEVYKVYDIHTWKSLTEDDLEKERQRLVKNEIRRRKREEEIENTN